MEELRELLEQEPTVEALDLRERGYDSSVFEVLVQFKELIEVDLSDNNITELPADMGAFENLRVIDITNNDLKDFEQTVEALASLPNLLDLKINLASEEEAVLILNNLPELQFLNGSSTEDEEMENLEEMEYSQDQEAVEQSEAYEENEVFEDIPTEQKNEFFEETEEANKTSSYRESKPREQTEEQVEEPIEEQFEEQEQGEEQVEEQREEQFEEQEQGEEAQFSVDIEADEAETYSLNEAVPVFEKLVKQLSTIFKKNKSPLAKGINHEYEQFLDKEAGELNEKLSEPQPNYLYAAANQQSKVNTLGFFIENILTLVGNRDSDLKKALLSIINEYKSTFERNNELLFKLYDLIHDKSAQYHKELEEAKESAAAQATSNNREGELEAEIEKLKKQNKTLSDEKNEEIAFLQGKITKLERQNKTMTERMLRSVQDVDFSHREDSVTESQSEMKSKMIHEKIYVNPTGARVLTKKMLKDTIHEIYMSKENFDKKCIESKMPKETMEQHMYTFLNQKYGLKVQF